MSEVVHLDREVVYRGSRWRCRHVFTDAEGTALDVSLATRTLVLRVKLRDGTTITRTKGTVGESEYETNGTDGDLTFLVETAVTLAFALGQAVAEISYADSLEPSKDLAFRWEVSVEDPRAGAI